LEQENESLSLLIKNYLLFVKDQLSYNKQNSNLIEDAYEKHTELKEKQLKFKGFSEVCNILFDRSDNKQTKAQNELNKITKNEIKDQKEKINSIYISIDQLCKIEEKYKINAIRIKNDIDGIYINKKKLCRHTIEIKNLKNKTYKINDLKEDFKSLFDKIKNGYSSQDDLMKNLKNLPNDILANRKEIIDFIKQNI